MRQSWNPLAVPIANTASGRFHSWVATLAAKSWIISRRLYRNHFLRHAVSHYQVNYDVHRQPTTTTSSTPPQPTLPLPLQRRLVYQHNFYTDAFSSYTTPHPPTRLLPLPLQRRLLQPTPPQPTQRPAHLHAYYHYHNHYNDASSSNTTPRLPTYLLHRRLPNRHNAPLTYTPTTITTTTTTTPPQPTQRPANRHNFYPYQLRHINYHNYDQGQVLPRHRSRTGSGQTNAVPAMILPLKASKRYPTVLRLFHLHIHSTPP